MNDDDMSVGDTCFSQAILGASGKDGLMIKGRYKVECVGTDGKIKWVEEFNNLVVTVGKNYILDTVLAGSGYSVTGPYIGLVSSVGYSALAAADTMSSHAGWTEAGNANAPTYTGNRKTAAFSAASGGSKSLSSTLSFAMTSTGTIKGLFMVLGSGAVNTKDDTNGTLFSVGLFTAGDRGVINGDTINANYSVGLT